MEQLDQGETFRPLTFIFDSDSDDPYCVLAQGMGSKEDLQLMLSALIPLMPVRTLVLVQDAFMKSVATKTEEDFYPEGMSLEQQYLLGKDDVSQALTILVINSSQEAVVASIIYEETDDGKLIWKEESINSDLSVEDVGGQLGNFLAKAADEISKERDERVPDIWRKFLNSDQAGSFVSSEEERDLALEAFDKIIEDDEARELAFRILEDNILSVCKFIPLKQSQGILDSRDKLEKLNEDSEIYKWLDQARLTN